MTKFPLKMTCVLSALIVNVALYHAVPLLTDQGTPHIANVEVAGQ